MPREKNSFGVKYDRALKHVTVEVVLPGTQPDVNDELPVSKVRIQEATIGLAKTMIPVVSVVAKKIFTIWQDAQNKMNSATSAPEGTVRGIDIGTVIDVIHELITTDLDRLLELIVDSMVNAQKGDDFVNLTMEEIRGLPPGLVIDLALAVYEVNFKQGSLAGKLDRLMKGQAKQ